MFNLDFQQLNVMEFQQFQNLNIVHQVKMFKIVFVSQKDFLQLWETVQFIQNVVISSGTLFGDSF